MNEKIDRIEKVSVIVISSFTNYMYHGLCLDSFEKCGIKVELIDIISILPIKCEPINYTHLPFIKLDSKQAFESYLAANDKKTTLYMCCLMYESRFTHLFEILNKFECRLGFAENGNFPEHPYLKRVITNKDLNMFAYRIWQKLSKWALSLSGKINLHYDFMLYDGNMSKRRVLKRDVKKMIAYNLPDYEYNTQALKTNDPTQYPSNYLVFLDVDMVSHEDFGIQNETTANYKPIDAKTYFDSINDYLDFIESTYGVEVIVSVHPKSRYKGGEYRHRKMIKGDTPKLVLNSKGVLLHGSTSQAYAILNYKPLIFIYTDEIKQNMKDTYDWLELVANALNAPIINVNRPYEKIDLNVMDKQRYDWYKYEFITTKDSEHRTNDEIMCEFIHSVNG